MANVLRRLSSSFSFLHKNPGPNPIRYYDQLQQNRGLRVRVRNGNVDQALNIMERRMKQSGMERLIKRYEDHEVYHMKNSEKRVLARKKLQVRIRSQELARKLQSIIVNKISDVYEGTRTARVADLPGIKQLVQPLEESGALIRRTDEELCRALDSFVVVERDGSIIACAALFPFFEEKCGEVAAIVVSPECRGHGQGDKLLDFIEKKALSMRLDNLFVLTTRTADWFVRRGFSECSIESIPLERRKKINPSRGSKYYMKKLQVQQGGITIEQVAFR